MDLKTLHVNPDFLYGVPAVKSDKVSIIPGVYQGLSQERWFLSVQRALYKNGITDGKLFY